MKRTMVVFLLNLTRNRPIEIEIAFFCKTFQQKLNAYAINLSLERYADS